MADVGRVLRLEARSTTLFLAVPVLAVIGVAAAWPTLIPGVGYWANAVAGVLNSVRVLGPVCAALAAWTAVREDPGLGYLRGLTVRSPATVPLLDLARLALVALPAYGIVTVVVSVKTVMHHEAGQFPVLGVVVGASVLLLQTAAGYLVGRLFPYLLTVPLMGLGSYLWAIASPDGVTSWSGLPTPAAAGRVDVFSIVPAGLLLGRLLWSFGLLGLLAAGYLMWLTRRFWLVVPVGMALGTAMAGAARVQTYDEPVTRAALAQECRSWPLTVCVHPALHPALRSLGTAVTPLATRLDGTAGEFSRVEQRPAGETGDQPRVAYVRIDNLSPGFERRVMRQILSSRMDAIACRGYQARRQATYTGYTGVVAAWLLDERPPRAEGPTAVLFGQHHEEHRRAWLRSHFDRFRSCALTAGDFRRITAAPVRRSLPTAPSAAATAPSASPVRRADQHYPIRQLG